MTLMSVASLHSGAFLQTLKCSCCVADKPSVGFAITGAPINIPLCCQKPAVGERTQRHQHPAVHPRSLLCDAVSLVCFLMLE